MLVTWVPGFLLLSTCYPEEHKHHLSWLLFYLPNCFLLSPFIICLLISNHQVGRFEGMNSKNLLRQQRVDFFLGWSFQMGVEAEPREGGSTSSNEQGSKIWILIFQLRIRLFSVVRFRPSNFSRNFDIWLGICIIWRLIWLHWLNMGAALLLFYTNSI